MNPSQKSFVLLSPGFPSSEEDSTCLPLQQLFIRKIHALHPELKVNILSFQYPYVKKKYSWFNSTVYSYSGRNKGGFTRLFLRRKIYATLNEIHAATPIAGLLSFWLGECALTGKRFAARNGIPHHCWILGQDARKDNKYGKRVRPANDELIALSDFLQWEFEKNHGVKPTHVIPLGMDAAPVNSKERDIDILGAGSLIVLKQFDIFLKVVAAIKKQVPALKVVLVGNGPEKKALQTQINRLMLEDTVTMTGEIPHQQVLQLMSRSKIFLHPSSYEGFSGVCQEALANGAQVISFCRAMKNDIDQWHIVQLEDEMLQRALKILEHPFARSENISVMSQQESVRRIMKLYSL